MHDRDFLATQFEAQRPRLKGVAYHMLGSLSEADDAVQEAWLRLDRFDGEVDNLAAWLTTVVGRVCLDFLRSRRSRREHPLDSDDGHVPDPMVLPADGGDPAGVALMTDSVGLALMVVLESLSPAERISFVLRDMFDLSFDEIASVVGRTPAAARQSASRARRRVRTVAAPGTVDHTLRRRVVDAFFAAAHGGEFDALLQVLDPDVVARSDAGTGVIGVSPVVRGATNVARQAVTYSQLAEVAHPILVNGSPGIVELREGRVCAVMGFTVRAGRITEIYTLSDPERLAHLDLSALGW